MEEAQRSNRTSSAAAWTTLATTPDRIHLWVGAEHTSPVATMEGREDADAAPVLDPTGGSKSSNV